jgi:DNA-binding IclR family transcriptional regulator
MAKKARARPEAESVATADRVLAVLTAFRRGDRTLSLADLAERTGLVKSTILRLIVSLESHGLIIRLHDGNYQLGAEVLRLGSIFQQSLELESHVMPILQDLVDRGKRVILRAAREPAPVRLSCRLAPSASASYPAGGHAPHGPVGDRPGAEGLC